MATPAELCSPNSSDDPNDLRGMAIVPLAPAELSHVESKPVDAKDLERKLRELTPEVSDDEGTLRAHAVADREELIAIGGRPSRLFQDFTPEQANAESVERYGIEWAMSELYGRENAYWMQELEHWQSFLKRRQLEFDHRKKISRTSSDEELPGAIEMDKAQLFTEYVAYQQGILDDYDVKKRALNTEWSRKRLTDKLHTIERQLQEIQEEQRTKKASEDPAHSSTTARVCEDDAIATKDFVFQKPSLPPLGIDRGTEGNVTKRITFDSRRSIVDNSSSRSLASLEANQSPKPHASPVVDMHVAVETAPSLEQDNPRIPEKSIHETNANGDQAGPPVKKRNNKSSRKNRKGLRSSSEPSTVSQVQKKTPPPQKVIRRRRRHSNGIKEENIISEKSSNPSKTPPPSSKILRRSARIANLQERKVSGM